MGKKIWEALSKLGVVSREYRSDCIKMVEALEVRDTKGMAKKIGYVNGSMNILSVNIKGGCVASKRRRISHLIQSSFYTKPIYPCLRILLRVFLVK